MSVPPDLYYNKTRLELLTSKGQKYRITEKEKFRMQQTPLETIVRMQPKGVITIPKKIRDAAGLKEGMYLRVTVNGRRITLEPIRLVPYHPK